jgi:hypothetical protein
VSGCRKLPEKCSFAHLLPFNIGISGRMIPDFAAHRLSVFQPKYGKSKALRPDFFGNATIIHASKRRPEFSAVWAYTPRSGDSGCKSSAAVGSGQI